MANNLYSASYFKPIVTSDDVPQLYSDKFPIPIRAIYVGVSGDVVLKDREGVVSTFVAVPAGSMIPVEPMYIMEATTATNLVGHF